MVSPEGKEKRSGGASSQERSCQVVKGRGRPQDLIPPGSQMGNQPFERAGDAVDLGWTGFGDKGDAQGFPPDQTVPGREWGRRRMKREPLPEEVVTWRVPPIASARVRPK